MINAYAIPGMKTKDEAVSDIVAEIWEVPKEALTTKTRQREVVEARQVLMTYRKLVTGKSLKKVGKEFGKDHATVLHAIQTVNNLIETDKVFHDKYKQFIERAYQLTHFKNEQ